MKKIENKKMEIVTETLGQVGEKFQILESKLKTSYADLIKEAVKTPNGDGGVGDLEMQVVKMKIVEKCMKDGDTVELEDAEVKIAQKAVALWKWRILHKDLIAFQTYIKGL